MNKFLASLALLILFALPVRAEVIHECFNSVNDMVAKINKLSDAQYTSLKIFVIPSSRNVFGIAGSPYNIIYKN
jgi:hypothetical protein